jgi:hypothetical protein
VAATGGQPELVGNRPDGGTLGVSDDARNARLSADGSVVVHLGYYHDLTAPGASAPATHNGLVMRSVAGADSEVLGVAPDGLWITDATDDDVVVDASGDRIILATRSGQLAPLADHNGVEDIYLLTRVIPQSTLFANGFEAHVAP